MPCRTDFRDVVQAAGGRYIGRRDNQIVFFDEQSGKRLSLYATACDEETVRLTIENARETPTPELEPACAARVLT